MSGVVFRHIAEGVMAQNVKRLVDDARDSTSNFTPGVKGGNEASATYVLNRLGLKGTAPKAVKTNQGIVPDVTGMGARDAVYELERRGLKVALVGRGKVKSQSIAAASILAKVARDRYMLEMAKQYPQWQFERHKGYGTKLHYEMIDKYGESPIHRPSFLKKYYAKLSEKQQKNR